MQTRSLLAAGVLAAAMFSTAATATDWSYNVQVGSRPYYLISKMTDSVLQERLQRCENKPLTVRDFSIGHRGVALEYPEHTKESYEAAARMGAGIIECDVTFTADGELVCRHSQCDLHTTTNILVTDLASKCTKPFVPAEYDATGKLQTPASALCCTSDITLAEYKSLCGKMDASNPAAKTPERYLAGTPDWRTDLNATYPVPTKPWLNRDGICTGTLLTHKESIDLIAGLGRKFTPELKTPSVSMPYTNAAYGISNFTQEQYAQKMIDEYKAAGISPSQVWAQSFYLPDVYYWIGAEPAFAQQAVYLEDAGSVADLPTKAEMQTWANNGVKILGSPLFALVALDAANQIVPSTYAKNAKAVGLDIIGWTFERSPPVQQIKANPARNGFYYQTVFRALEEDGDILKVLDVAARKVGVLGMFSDYPGTTTYYANCLGLD